MLIYFICQLLSGVKEYKYDYGFAMSFCKNIFYVFFSSIIWEMHIDKRYVFLIYGTCSHYEMSLCPLVILFDLTAICS